MPKRRHSMLASEGHPPQTFSNPPAAPSPSPFWQSPSPQLPHSSTPSPPSQTPEEELEAGAIDSEQRTATGWAFTTLGSYVPEPIMNLFAAPLRVAERFFSRVLHPQQIRVESFVRDDGARKVRLVSPRARDVVTPTKAGYTKSSEKTRATLPAMRSTYNMPGAWPMESLLGPPPIINVSKSPFLSGPQTPLQRYAIYDDYDLIANPDDLGSPDWTSTPPPHFNDMLVEHDSPLLQHLRPQPEIAPPKNIFLTPHPAAANTPPPRLPHDRVQALRTAGSSPLKPHKITSPKLRERYQYQSKNAQSPPRVHKRNNRRSLQSILRSRVDDSYNIWIAEATRDNATDQNSHNVSESNENSAKTLTPIRATAPEFAVGSPSPYENDESMLPDAPEIKHIHFNEATRVKEFLPYYRAVYQVDGRDQLPYLDRSHEEESIKEGEPVRSPLTGRGSKYFKAAYPYSFKAVFVDSNVSSMQDKALEQVKQKLDAAYDEQDSLLANIKEKDEEASFLGETKTFDGRLHGCRRYRGPKEKPFEDESGHVFYEIPDSSDGEDEDDVDGPSLGEETEVEIKHSEDDTKGVKETDKDGVKTSLEESMLSLELAKTIIASLPTPIPAPPPPVLAPLVAQLTVLENTELDTAVQKALANRSAPLVRYMSVHDFGTLLPTMFRGDPLAWLNDNIVNEYLDILTNHVKQAENYTHKRDGKAPPVHNFSSQWYTTMMKNEKSVARWAGRKQLGGKNFLDSRLVLFPICDGNHWRLVAAKPQERLIEYFDSLGGSGHQYTRAVLRYIELELGEHFVANEWKILGADKSEQKSQRQTNASDCGLFTVLNALVLLREEEHTRVEVTHFMNDARKRVAITLLAGKATAEFA